MKRYLAYWTLVAAFTAFATMVIPYRYSPFRPHWMDLSLGGERASIASPAWQEIELGLEYADADVFVGREKVDTIHLTRISPETHKFIVRVDPRNPVTVTEWQNRLGASVVINGSYYASSNLPATPSRSGGNSYGPREYRSTHGGIVLDGAAPRILEFNDESPWKYFAESGEAFASFPLLVSSAHAVGHGKPDWLATRTFIGVMADGRTIFGMSSTGFFSLPRLAEALGSSDLQLTNAINLDGGPLSSMAVSTAGFTRAHYGTFELQSDWSIAHLAYDRVRQPGWKLPIVVAAVRRTALSERS